MNELSESISGVPLVGTSLFNGLACCPSFPATQWCDSICTGVYVIPLKSKRSIQFRLVENYYVA